MKGFLKRLLVFPLMMILCFVYLLVNILDDIESMLRGQSSITKEIWKLLDGIIHKIQVWSGWMVNENTDWPED